MTCITALEQSLSDVAYPYLVMYKRLDIFPRLALTIQRLNAVAFFSTFAVSDHGE